MELEILSGRDDGNQSPLCPLKGSKPTDFPPTVGLPTLDVGLPHSSSLKETRAPREMANPQVWAR